MKYTIKAQAKPPAGFWRGGVKWAGDEPSIHVVDLDADELAMIKAEPNLVVFEVEADSSQEPEKARKRP